MLVISVLRKWNVNWGVCLSCFVGQWYKRGIWEVLMQVWIPGNIVHWMHGWVLHWDSERDAHYLSTLVISHFTVIKIWRRQYMCIMHVKEMVYMQVLGQLWFLEFCVKILEILCSFFADCFANAVHIPNVFNVHCVPVTAQLPRILSKWVQIYVAFICFA